MHHGLHPHCDACRTASAYMGSFTVGRRWRAYNAHKQTGLACHSPLSTATKHQHGEQASQAASCTTHHGAAVKCYRLLQGVMHAAGHQLVTGQQACKLVRHRINAFEFCLIDCCGSCCVLLGTMLQSRQVSCPAHHCCLA